MTGCSAMPEAAPVRRKAPLTLSVALPAIAGLAIHLGCVSAARAADTPAYPQGAAAFQANCAVCHGPSGTGVPALAPPLSSYPARYAASAEGRRQLAMTVLYGMIGDITVGEAHFNSQMPDFARLDDATVAATLNFVVFDLARAGADIKPFAPGEIAAERAHAVDAAAVREHRKSLAAGGS
jgi:mono/diheme cytochrome c family protein